MQASRSTNAAALSRLIGTAYSDIKCGLKTASRFAGGRGVKKRRVETCIRRYERGWLGLLHEMFGRKRSLPRGPMAETFEAYRTRVLSYLGDEEPIGVQQATPSQLDRRLRDVAPEELIRRPAPEKWSIAEIAAHLADAELAMGWRLRNMLANPGVALTWWDEAAWAERLGYAQQDASLSAGVFRALRESNLRLLESVPRARWVECYGVHEVRGRQTVEEFVRLEAAHDLNHLRQIDRILGGCM